MEKLKVNWQNESKSSDTRLFFTVRDKKTDQSTESKSAVPQNKKDINKYNTIINSLAPAINLPPKNILIPHQTHSSRVAIVDQNTQLKELLGFDGLVTNQKQLCVCVQTADCVPVLLYDPFNKVIGAIHAGWRGTASGIIGQAINAFTDTFESNPANINAFIGPCITHKVYEVGQDVYDAFSLIQLTHKNILTPAESKNKYYLDLKNANSELLLKSGLLAKNISVSPYCTFNDAELFYSARRQGVKAGRIISGIFLT